MWIDAVSEQQRKGEASILVTILGTAGSAPRKTGSKMLVTARQSFDTIGGGHLEYLIIQKARELLANSSREPLLEHFPLGPKLGQCCGGSVSVLLEPLSGCDFHIALFGAGHIGKSLIDVLAPLDCQITWIDNRPELFPEKVPDNVTVCVSEQPEQEVEDLPDDVYSLVVTHNHQLDYSIVEATLKHNKSHWLGVIGSETKARRFQQRLGYRGLFTDEQIQHMSCPVGIDAVGGRKPAEIAIAIAGEILSVRNGSRSTQKRKREGIPWQNLKSLLTTAEAEAEVERA